MIVFLLTKSSSFKILTFYFILNFIVIFIKPISIRKYSKTIVALDVAKNHIHLENKTQNSKLILENNHKYESLHLHKHDTEYIHDNNIYFSSNNNNNNSNNGQQRTGRFCKSENDCVVQRIDAYTCYQVIIIIMWSYNILLINY